MGPRKNIKSSRLSSSGFLNGPLFLSTLYFVADKYISEWCVWQANDIIYLWRGLTITSGSLLPALWLPSFYWLVLFSLFNFTKTKYMYSVNIKSSLPVPFVDVSAMRAHFASNFTHQILHSKKIYTSRPSFVAKYLKMTKLCYFNQDSPHFLVF